MVLLRYFVREALEEGTSSDCFDGNLGGFAEMELIQVLKLGLIFTVDLQARRPDMAEVIQLLECIKPNN